jgi:hypothetical protein
MTVTAAPTNTSRRDPRDLYRYGRVADALTSPDAVSDAHVAAYHRDGFLAVENVLSPNEVKRGAPGA